MKKQLLNNKICIRLKDEPFEAYCYLKKHKLNPANYLRKGGESELIRVAKEYRFREQKIKIYGQNMPDWI